MEKIIQKGNQRVAKNTLLLYIRMLLLMAISLYTSRIVLVTLGEVDFGIYNVVGGFVAMFAIANKAMATATQRFLSFEIGKEKNGKVKQVFSTAVIIHIIIAIAILIIAESFGVWFINEKMNFPPNRYVAANWVFQFSLAAFVIGVISVPYNAALIAYERMAAFAYVSIVEAVLKLLIVYLITISPIDHLIFYSSLITLVAILIRVIYGVYVKRHLYECICDGKIDKQYLKQLLPFVSWNLIGSIAMIAKEQGLNVVLNMFFGAAVNAARGIAYQVLHAVSGFATNFQLAMNPQIIKYYAADKKEEMYKLVFRGSKFSYLLLLILSLPFIIKAQYILELWLVKVPNFSAVFLQLVLIMTLVDSLSYTLITSVHASGKVKWYQIINGSFLLLTLPIVYISFKLGLQAYWAMIISTLISVVCLFVRLIILHRLIGFPLYAFLYKVVAKVFLITIIASIFPYLLSISLGNTFLAFILTTSASLVTSISFSFMLGLDHMERKMLLQKAYEIKKRFL